MFPKSRALACAATAVGLLLGMAGPAVADVERFTDTSNDTTNDIRWVQVDNSTANPNKVIVTVQTDDIGTSGCCAVDELKVFFDTRATDPGPEFSIILIQDSVMYRMENWKRNGSYVSTAGGCNYGVSRNFTTDRWRVVTTRACLGDPGRIRVAARTTRREPRFSQDWARAPRTWLGWVAR
jgi:hypothetical protein